MEPILCRLPLGSGYHSLSVRGSMKVRVRLYAFLAELHSESTRAGSPLDLDLAEDSTVASLVDYLALPKEQVKLTVVNGRLREPEHCLEPDDEVGIFPPVAGG